MLDGHLSWGYWKNRRAGLRAIGRHSGMRLGCKCLPKKCAPLEKRSEYMVTAEKRTIRRSYAGKLQTAQLVGTRNPGFAVE